ncbi:O-linked N-acetylglucosamine transferase, OGT-like protein [Sarcoptes scabiei]|nr:O-linked N-acetylglucosamine transferase, OGT-like protein [Sarcoptes scabiei]
MDWTDELRLYIKDVSVCPANAKIYYNIAKIQADIGEKEESILNYRKAISLNENYTNALNNLANILREDPQYQLEALNLLQRACLLDEKFAVGWLNLATLELSLNMFNESEYHYLKSIDLRPTNPNGYFNLANLYLKSGRFIEAEINFKKAIEVDEKFTKAWHNLILLKQNLNQIPEAVEIIYKAFKSLPEDDGIHFHMANILAKKKEFSKAEFHFMEAIRLNSNNALYHNNLAVLYHLEGRYSKAIEFYRKTLYLNPIHTAARKNLDILLNKIVESKSQTA